MKYPNCLKKSIFFVGNSYTYLHVDPYFNGDCELLISRKSKSEIILFQRY
ncbi:hypothetical protein C8D94_104265 [Marinirhabdus gelatinilytica]|uniref:Uncharacterized protein n=1 Tax=Marinirhabdus gelatinilytica TaxID=1703343 RepID=A0A370Q948_9FLAO|nr:hypothetical protein C8D94_104265 [Marinirhabdus gelatinilytica]